MFDGKSFLTGVSLSWFVFGAFHVCRNYWLKRVTFTTILGQKVHDMGTPKHTGFTINKAQMDFAEKVFLEMAWQKFGSDKIKAMFAKNHIFYHPHPIPSRGSDSGFANADESGNMIRLGIFPWISRTAIVHEWVGKLLPEHIHPDENPDLAEYWEGGLVGAVNAELEKHVKGLALVRS